MQKVKKMMLWFGIASFSVVPSFGFDTSKLKDVDGLGKVKRKRGSVAERMPHQPKRSVNFTGDLGPEDGAGKIDDKAKRHSTDHIEKIKKEKKANHLEQSQADAEARAQKLNGLVNNYHAQSAQELLPLFMKMYNAAIDDPTAHADIPGGFGGQESIKNLPQARRILEGLAARRERIKIDVEDGNTLGATYGVSSGTGLVYIARERGTGNPITPLIHHDGAKIKADISGRKTKNAAVAGDERKKEREKILSGTAPCPVRYTDVIFMAGPAVRSRFSLTAKEVSVKNVFASPPNIQNFLATNEHANFMSIIDKKIGRVGFRLAAQPGDEVQGGRTMRTCAYTIPELAEFFKNETAGGAQTSEVSPKNKSLGQRIKDKRPSFLKRNKRRTREV